MPHLPRRPSASGRLRSPMIPSGRHPTGVAPPGHQNPAYLIERPATCSAALGSGREALRTRPPRSTLPTVRPGPPATPWGLFPFHVAAHHTELTRPQPLAAVALAPTPAPAPAPASTTAEQRQVEVEEHLTRILKHGVADLKGAIGMTSSASVDVTMAALKRLSRMCHPDKCSDPRATPAQQVLNEALAAFQSDTSWRDHQRAAEEARAASVRLGHERTSAGGVPKLIVILPETKPGPGDDKPEVDDQTTRPSREGAPGQRSRRRDRQ